MKRRSIRFRLTAWYSLILAATLAVVGVGVWFALQDSIDETVDKELRSRIQQMREHLARGSREGEQPIEELREDAAFAPAGTRFRIAAVDGGWLFRSRGTGCLGRRAQCREPAQTRP